MITELIATHTAPGPSILAFGMPGGTEWIILLVLGLLIFGRRLPEVGRSLGRGIVEFKKGIKGIDDEIEAASSGELPDASSPKLEQGQSGTVSKASIPGEKANPYTPQERPGS